VSVVDAWLVTETLGAAFSLNFIHKPTNGTRGGILLAYNDDFALVHEPLADGPNSITGQIADKTNGDTWTVGCTDLKKTGRRFCFCRSSEMLSSLPKRNG
jgi:hypothetical protein